MGLNFPNRITKWRMWSRIFTNAMLGTYKFCKKRILILKRIEKLKWCSSIQFIQINKTRKGTEKLLQWVILIDQKNATWYKKYITCIWCKVSIQVQQTLNKVSSRTHWNISKSIATKFTHRKKIRRCFSSQILSLQMETGVFYYPGPMITLFNAVRCIFIGSSA